MNRTLTTAGGAPLRQIGPFCEGTEKWPVRARAQEEFVDSLIGDLVIDWGFEDF
jgi:hypothetical protein